MRAATVLEVAAFSGRFLAQADSVKAPKTCLATAKAGLAK